MKMSDRVIQLCKGQNTLLLDMSEFVSLYLVMKILFCVIFYFATGGVRNMRKKY